MPNGAVRQQGPQGGSPLTGGNKKSKRPRAIAADQDELQMGIRWKKAGFMAKGRLGRLLLVAEGFDDV